MIQYANILLSSLSFRVLILEMTSNVSFYCFKSIV